jgi:hypothetical protein
VDGQLQVFNGTFAPSLSTWDPQAQTWNHETFGDWGVSNSGTRGRVAVLGSKVYLTQMQNGNFIICFDQETNAVVRLQVPGRPQDVVIGQDGFLHVLSSDRYVDTYNPANLSFVKRVDLSPILGTTTRTGIAVDRESNIFVVDFDAQISKVSRTGEVIATLVAEPAVGRNFWDVDLDGNGNVIAGLDSNHIFVADSNLSSYYEIVLPLTLENAFVTFVNKANVQPRFPGDYFGTDRNDSIHVDLESQTVTINGEPNLIPEGSGLVRVFGGLGSRDHITFSGSPDLSEFAVLDTGFGRMMVEDEASTLFRALQFRDLHFVATDESDSALLVDSPADDVLEISPFEAELSDGTRSVSATAVSQLFAVSFFGDDAANYVGTVGTDQIYCDLDDLFVSATNGNTRMVMRNFRSFFARGLLSDQTDSVVVRGSADTDYLYSREDFTTIFNEQFDYSFASFEQLNAYSDNQSFDRATLIKTPASRFRESADWKQMVGPGFRNSVFQFDQVDVIETP